MKTTPAFAFRATLAFLAEPAAAAPAQRAGSLSLAKRLDGPVTVSLTHTTSGGGGGGAFERSKFLLASKYPQLFDDEELAVLRKRADGLSLQNVYPDTLWTAPTAFGTPPQTLPLLVDTGSATLWAFSAKCVGCGTGSFDVGASCTFVNTSEPAAYGYGTGSTQISGWRVEDTIGLGGVSTEGVEFAVIDAQRNARLNETAAGLSGWSWPSTDAAGRNATPVPYVQAHGQWTEPTFGLFLNRRNPRAERAGTQSRGPGALTVSGVDTGYFDGELAWTPRELIRPQLSWAWSVRFPSLSVDGKAVPLPNETYAILDSGTTLVYGPPGTVADLWARVPGATPNGDGTWGLDCDRTDIHASFSFAGRDWDIDPTDLVYRNDQTGKCFGAIVYNLGMSGLRPHWLIGGAFLKNVYTAYQYDPPRVGFAKLKEDL